MIFRDISPHFTDETIEANGVWIIQWPKVNIFMNKDIHTCTTSQCVHWLQTRHTQSYFPLYLKHLSCESHVIKNWWYPKKIVHNTIRLLLSCFYLSLMDIQISVLRSFVYETVLGSYSEIKSSPVKAVYRSFWIFFFFSCFFFIFILFLSIIITGQ